MATLDEQRRKMGAAGLPHIIAFETLNDVYVLHSAYAEESTRDAIKRYLYDESYRSGYGKLDWLLDEARKREKWARMDGEPSGNLKLIEELLLASADVMDLVNHHCAFPYDEEGRPGYCPICGADGQA